jgi:sigma-70-like protein
MNGILKDLPRLCRICKTIERELSQDICDNCKEYIDQDQVYQRELTMDVSGLENLDGANIGGRPNKFVWSDPIKPPEIPTLNTLIRKAGVTRQQRVILKLHFEETQSFSSIGKRLGISKDCAKARYRRAIKRLKREYPKLLWMRGKDKPNSQDPTPPHTNVTTIPE